MAFRTKLDYSDNRQIKQRERTSTILSGTTVFGVSFSGLTSGPDLTTSAQTSQFFGVISTYSGNSATTIFTWGIPGVSILDPYISALTPSNSGVSQNIGAVFAPSSSTIIDGNLVNLTYSGVSFQNFYPITMTEPTLGNYTGSVSTDFFIFSAGTLDFTGRTIWIDNSEILRTKKLIVSDNPQVGYVLTSDLDGLATWQSISAVTSGTTFWSASTGLYAIVTESSLNLASGDYAISEGYQSTASGNHSLAEGFETTAIGDYSHVEGQNTTTIGIASHAEGRSTTAIGATSHAEGRNTTASGIYSHVEGFGTIASGNSAHAEGFDTTAIGNFSHAEGRITIASGGQSHAEGSNTMAIGFASHAEGSQTTASGPSSHSEGQQTTAIGAASHAEGFGTIANNDFSHSEGYTTTASGDFGSHAEGNNTVASDLSSHAEGGFTTASGIYSHAEGKDTIASGGQAHAEGGQTTAIGDESHAEGRQTTSIGFSSHAEGFFTTASGFVSHAEGNGTIASGSSSHAEGSSTIAGGTSSHAEGNQTTASGPSSHSEGFETTASGDSSHAEGSNTTASGNYSHAGGDNSTSIGDYSFVHGLNSTATANSTIVLGDNLNGTIGNHTYVESLNINLVGATAFVNDIRIDANGFLTTNTSDERLKENINPISNALNKIKNLQGVTYQWKDRSAGGDNVRLGFIAQQVENVEPLLVFTNKNSEYKGIHIDGIIPLLVEAIKEITTSNRLILETQTVVAEDNNIELNYNGTKQTAIGGGISVINGLGDGISAEFKLNPEGSWITNSSIAPLSLIIPERTPNYSSDNYGKVGDVTRDENYLYIKGNNGWGRLTLESF